VANDAQDVAAIALDPGEHTPTARIFYDKASRTLFLVPCRSCQYDEIQKRIAQALVPPQPQPPRQPPQVSPELVRFIVYAYDSTPGEGAGGPSVAILPECNLGLVRDNVLQDVPRGQIRHFELPAGTTRFCVIYRLSNRYYCDRRLVVATGEQHV